MRQNSNLPLGFGCVLDGVFDEQADRFGATGLVGMAFSPTNFKKSSVTRIWKVRLYVCRGGRQVDCGRIRQIRARGYSDRRARVREM